MLALQVSNPRGFCRKSWLNDKFLLVVVTAFQIAVPFLIASFHELRQKSDSFIHWIQNRPQSDQHGQNVNNQRSSLVAERPGIF
jgi:hypothetical protein